ncbi:MAG TPA: ABC transporter substrate-binding protein [Lachnospiraceae bacterium]
MRKGTKKVVTGAVTAVVAAGLLAGCGSSAGKSGDSAKSGGSDTITIFNSKMEIQEQMEKMAEDYSKEKGVKVEVYYSSDTVSAHLATRYASNEPYTISMVDAKDIYSLAAEHAIDLSDQDWIENTEQEIAIDGKVYGFPVCIEARGLIYNADAIKKATGKEFDPSAIKTTDDFKALIEELKKGGMETPVGVMKEDWSLAAHYLPQVYEEQKDPEAFVQSLYKGEAKLAENAKWTSLMDTFDVLKENNYAKDAAISAEREVTEQKLAEGEIAFMFGGNWDWSVINAYEYSENMGMMPIPQNTDDGSNEKLVGGGSKYLFIDSSENTSEEQQKAAKDFLSWLVNDEAGQKFIAEDCALVPAFKNNTLEVADPLGKSVKKYADAGELIGNYNYLPDDHYSVLGASFQKYLAGETDRAGLAKEIETYWSTVKPVEH